MKEMQFFNMTIMALLTLTLLVLLPKKVALDRVLNRSKWLLAAGTTLMSIQFLLQWSIGFREMGITQAVLINLLFFVPCAWLFSLSLLNLQQQGWIGLRFWVPGIATWAIIVCLIVGASFIDGQPLLTDTEEKQWAEYIAGLVYCIMQAYYTAWLIHQNRRLRKALDDYYDNENNDLLRWMEHSIAMLGLIAIAAPFLIFSSGLLLVAYAILVFFFIYYLVFNFVCYSVSNDSRTLEEAQISIDKNDTSGTGLKHDDDNEDQQLKFIDLAINRWLTTKHYLTYGITMPQAAAETRLSIKQFRSWYQAQGYDSYSDWLHYLRIEEAKQLIASHPDWSFDVIAEQCGFQNRSYFHKIFLKRTGMTPAQYITKINNNA